MLKNYFKIALRSLFKRRLFSLINILGLVLGLLTFLVLYAFVITEFSYNDFHANKDRIFQVVIEEKNGTYETYLPPGYAGIITSNFSSVQSVERVAGYIGSGLVAIPDTDLAFKENAVGFVERDFFQNFSFPIERGTADLSKPYSAVITKQLAEKYFGEADAIGKSISLSNQFGKADFTITGVLQPIPELSDLQSDIFLSIHTLERPEYRKENGWADPNGLESGFVNLFLVAKEGEDVSELPGLLTDFASKVPDSKVANVLLQPLDEIHLGSSIADPMPKVSSMGSILVFLAMAVLILFIAFVNYINLSSANLLTRIKEIRMRKVLGAYSWQLAQQFMVETFLLMGLALILALGLFNLLDPLFFEILGKPVWTGVLLELITILVICGILGFAALFSGLYVVFLSGQFEKKSKLRFIASEGQWGRKALVVFQFVISIGIIVCTLVIRDQLSFMQQQPLGMNLNQRVVVEGPEDFKGDRKGKMNAFKEKLSSQSFIQGIAGSNSLPGYSYNFSAGGITPLVPRPEDKDYSYSMFIIDNEFIPTYGIEVVAGRNFTFEEADANWNNLPKVMLNAKAARQLGFENPESAVGQSILWGKPYEVVGVIADYHHMSLREEISPMILLAAQASGYFTLIMDTQEMQGNLAQVQSIYQEIFPGNPFTYSFLDEIYGRQYQAEQQLSRAFSIAGALAILISCLGLFGLAAYSVQQRTKEIGIRKVLGASTQSLLNLISKDFLILVGIAMVLAFPLAWYAMQSWQADFPYRAGLSWITFVWAGMGSMGIALLTVGFQALKAAWSNPVESIRNE
ncbi:putative ABC transport system permease protein [Algoriphagus boseongensis]|uniref:Putative ABC transport system permease protein n=1 Tax=Algoriphagus boseongensis TaxID=1442587 RepID=A0A4R6T9F1_9BACT|nr:ABC transporter permease [Algoriphagus boseongensis]TDQ18492.1 putative ABC transport system permease protein [Algoriphagus boseongensis]